MSTELPSPASLLDPAVWDSRRFDGAWRPADTVRPVVEPATGAVLAHAAVASPADIAAAASAAAAAQPDWAATPFHVRAAVLRRAGDLFEAHAAEIHEWLMRESGAVPMKAGFETHVAAAECHEAAALASAPIGELLPSESPRLSMARRVPVGVVGVIAPFNAPLILGIRSVAAALALGNAVVLKPDPRTAVCGGVAMARVFEEAGLPAGLLHLVPGGPDVGEAIVTDPNIRVISFTGSTRAGRAVAAAGGRLLKRVHLELGGNSALLVLDDADVEAAASAAAFGSFFHQGQICMTAGRHLVHERLHDAFVDALTAKAAAMTVGDPFTDKVDLGPVIDAGQREKIHALVHAGGQVTTGGSYEDLFYRPTVVRAADDATPVWREEVFGPVAPVRTFTSEQEAVHLAAASDYGLSLGIITRDVMKALDLAERIPTGIVHINDQTVGDEAHAPFGGVRASGTGARFGGRTANTEAFTETRWITAQSRPGPYLW
ncbi:aldehyde dehydrogenase family protein [Glycomyces artemisiae]|uniref:Benzaldehyde dehydrogenase (NAD) n=1 Tax=Glycomyces artemisiae TaxID=1076443 RepID=A0A2T0URL4_9ACTN|nr:aldehyde dehydrogenase family protein [Glycomyces artemisiae]PRY60553.1 benzaldehyde dehydrogenase (NAD) [Glycomyces artemisiae]